MAFIQSFLWGLKFVIYGGYMLNHYMDKCSGPTSSVKLNEQVLYDCFPTDCGKLASVPGIPRTAPMCRYSPGCTCR